MQSNPTQKESDHDYDHAAHPEHHPHERAAVLPREGRGRRPRGADPHAVPPGRVRADPVPAPRHGDPDPGVLGRPGAGHAQAPLMSVTKRVLPSGTVTWRAKVFFEHRVIAQKSFPRRVDAKRWEADHLSKLQSGTWIDPARGRVTFAALATEWQASREHLAVRSQETTEFLLDSYVLPVLGPLPIAAISATVVEPPHGLGVRVHRAATQSKRTSGAVFGPTKTHQTRTVPVPAALDGYVRHRVATTAPGGYLFPSPTGGVWTNTNFRARSRWMDATRAAGVEGTTIHDLRHTAASLLIAAGADVKAVQVILGHSTATMTMDLYGHLFSEATWAAMERLPAIPLLSAPPAAIGPPSTEPPGTSD